MTISIIIPAYNGSRFIEKAILSVLGQKRPADEIIVCDDNSTDDTLAICDKYTDRLKIYRNPDGPSGFVNGWNKAIGYATGDYISILHQDDTLSPDFLRLGTAALERNPAIRHLFCTCRYIDAEDRTLSLSYASTVPAPGARASTAFDAAAWITSGATSLAAPGSIAPASEVHYSGRQYFAAYQRQGQPHIHRCPGVLTHWSIFRQCRYEAAAGHIADDDFFYRVGQYTDVIGILLPLASFRLHEGSVTGSLDDTQLARQLAEDYLYQCRQWKDHPFIDENGYDWFVRNAQMYSRRYVGYAVRQGQLGRIWAGLRQWWTVMQLG